MSNIQTGAERMPHDLSHLGFLAGQIGRLITISTTPVIAGDSFEMDAVGAFCFSSRRRHTGFDCDWGSDVCSSDLRRLRLALPVVISRSSQVVVGVSDAIMVAPLGEAALAATTTGATNTFNLLILPMGLVFIVSSFTDRKSVV